ncbi:hypothetical protein [Kordiimonas sp.]|uniref:hypothetical protein n=1 Tax=Kordiimonas sp. TaxID=1970157 RepID=UPI003A93CB5D
MQRQLYILSGSLVMALVLCGAIWLPEGLHGTGARWAARGALVGVFICLRLRRYQMQPLYTTHVLLSAATGGVIVMAVASLWLMDAAPAPLLWLTPILCASLLSLSFHLLTLGRGRMV